MTELLKVIDEMASDIWQACIGRHKADGFHYCDYCGHPAGDSRAHALLDPYCPVARALCAAQTALEKGGVR